MADCRNQLSPDCIEARYVAQRIPQYKDNPLIEALPPIRDDEELLSSLTLAPEFEPDQRSWPTSERVHLLEGLQNFMVPFAKHLELARALDSMLRTGYVGRAPRTPEHARISQDIYERQMAGLSFRQSADTRTPQLSRSLIGISGMGKTTTVRRCLANLPRVIYHPDLHVYQIPYLHVEMPSDGSSIKGLAHGILSQVDELIPGANYYQEHALRGKPGADTLMRSVARIMHQHFVGILVGDEVQNIANAHKGDQTVMTELVSACNALGVPILFIGTNKAAKILKLDFRTARRGSGHRIAPWDRLPESVADDDIDEWIEFLDVLWKYQWVRRPVELDHLLVATMYRLSQGVIDIAIKLFASAQARAMLDGSETITVELLKSVYDTELQFLHPMLSALRDDNLEELAKYDDVAPIALDEILAKMRRKLKAKASPLHGVKSSDATYATRVATSLMAAGFDEDDALAAAEDTMDAQRPVTVLQGVKSALGALSTPAKVPRAKPTDPVEAIPTFEDRPKDYRRAISAARQNKTPILSELRALKLIRPMSEVLHLR